MPREEFNKSILFEHFIYFSNVILGAYTGDDLS
jgi:hypothetical protein